MSSFVSSERLRANSAGVRHGFDGEFIDFFAVHLGIGHTVFAQGIGRRHFDTAGRDGQEITACPIGTHSTAEDAIAAGDRADDSSAGAISEEDARRAVFPVDDAGQDFCTDDQNIFIHLIFNELGSDDRAVSKARAGCFQIEGRCIDSVEIGLDFAGRRRRPGPGSACRR